MAKSYNVDILSQGRAVQTLTGFESRKSAKKAGRKIVRGEQLEGHAPMTDAERQAVQAYGSSPLKFRVGKVPDPEAAAAKAAKRLRKE